MNTKIKEPVLCIKEESISLSDNTDKTDRPMCPVTTVDTMHGRSLLMSKAFTPQAMFKAFHDLKKPIRFKESVQKYELNAFRNISKFIIEYQNGTYTVHKGSEFNLSERGKIRHICATPIYDRVPIRSFCDNVLIPALRPYLIYDNCASLKGRGIDMQRNRMKVHLQRYFRQYHSNDGYILQGDFSKFFDNLDHDKIIKAISEKIKDTYSLEFIKMVLKSFCLDFSNCSDAEIEAYKNGTFIFLKTKYTLTVTGKVVMSLSSDTFKREAIKLRKFKKLYLNKKLTLDIIIFQFKSWRGSVTRKQFHNHKAVKQLDNLFFQLFNLKYEDLKNGRSKRKRSE